ncbi:uncharacterized protein V1510DRAFT_359207 [Dipodascopsis tothii]|uniref:uncharacterized protein n=1 Tax=Dipodascopsis tothii TaxID=44089 RepID=UPI0034CE1C75
MSFISKYFANKFFKESVVNQYGITEDPYYENIPEAELGKKKKGSRRKRTAPPGISEHDAQVLHKVLRRAHYLEMCLGSICGVRMGWGSVIGLIPFVGDIIAGYLGAMVIDLAKTVDGGLPLWLQMRMLTNLALDFGLGLIPIVGDAVDAVYKSNCRNALMLEAHLRKKGEKALRAHGVQPQPAPAPTDKRASIARHGLDAR